MPDSDATPWPQKIAELITALAQPLNAPTPAEWAFSLKAALDDTALSYLIALGVQLRAAGLKVPFERLTEVAAHLIGSGAMPEMFDAAVTAKMNTVTRTTEAALGKPKKPRGAGFRR